MTRADILTMLNGVGVPTAYRSFPEGTGQEPPFICFYYPEINALRADNKNYFVSDTLIIELYTDNKDFELESTLEGILDENELPFDKYEEYIGSERMFQITYTTAVYF